MPDPKTVEVDESQFLNSQKVVKTMAALLQNPQARRKVLEAHKIIDPNTPIPELDAAAPIESEMKALRAEMEKDRKDRADERAKEDGERKLAQLNADVESGLAKLRANGVTDEGIAGVKKLMEEKGILDPEIAWAYFDKLHPPQEPVSPKGFGSWSFFDVPSDGGDEKIKKLIESRGDNESVLNAMVNEALTDSRGTPRR